LDVYDRAALANEIVKHVKEQHPDVYAFGAAKLEALVVQSLCRALILAPEHEQRSAREQLFARVGSIAHEPWFGEFKSRSSATTDMVHSLAAVGSIEAAVALAEKAAPARAHLVCTALVDGVVSSPVVRPQADHSQTSSELLRGALAARTEITPELLTAAFKILAREPFPLADLEEVVALSGRCADLSVGRLGQIYLLQRRVQLGAAGAGATAAGVLAAKELRAELCKQAPLTKAEATVLAEVESLAVDGPKAKGVVDIWRGAFGFIKRLDTAGSKKLSKERIFCHKSQLLDGHVLKVGSTVEFHAEKNVEKGQWHAKKVTGAYPDV
jgi:hypothetical protein